MNTTAKKSIFSVLFSPAVSLAILGTAAFVFSFWAGQLSSLVVPKDFSKPSPPVVQEALPPVTPKIDINSRALLAAIDTSAPTKLALSGNSKLAVEEALKNLTDNSPTDVANIALCGDILSAVGGDKEERGIGFALLAKAVNLAPENQSLISRYAQRLAAVGQMEQARQQLVALLKDHPQLSSVHLILAKIYWLEGKSEAAVNELLTIKDGQRLTAKEQEEAALMFVKTGRIYDGYKLFLQAMSGKKETRFYAGYIADSMDTSADSLKTALAIVEANLNNGPHSNIASLEIKRAVMLLLLDSNKDAKACLDQANEKFKNNFDLQVLQAAANFAAGDPDHALSGLEQSAKNYQPKL